MKKLLLLMIPLLFPVGLLSGETPRILSLEEFIERSVKSDPSFQVILADELYLKYSKDLELPVSDLVIGITGQYNLMLKNSSGQDDDTYEGTVSLSKFFPRSGTTLSMDYSAQRYLYQNSSAVRSTINARVAQSIARNALGRTTRLTERRIGMEDSLARYQIVEAYEDYMAALITVYMDWYSSRENLKAAEKSLQYSSELLALVRRRRQFRVALPEEVDKLNLEVMSAGENLARLRMEYERNMNMVLESCALPDGGEYIPVEPRINDDGRSFTEASVETVLSTGRTSHMLALMEKKGVLSTQIAEDNLFPSVELFAGYRARGSDYSFIDPEHIIYGGITTEIIPERSREKAEYAVARVDLRKILLSNRSSILTLKQDLKNLVLSIGLERELIDIAEKKIVTAGRILEAERRNFMIGKVSLNDLITAKNNLEQFRYSAIRHRIILQQLIVEWKRLSDTLVDRPQLNQQAPK